jgi:hypothetical protein
MGEADSYVTDSPEPGHPRSWSIGGEICHRSTTIMTMGGSRRAQRPRQQTCLAARSAGQSQASDGGQA